MKKLTLDLDFWFNVGESDSHSNVWNPPNHDKKCFDIYCAGQEWEYAFRFLTLRDFEIEEEDRDF